MSSEHPDRAGDGQEPSRDELLVERDRGLAGVLDRLSDQAKEIDLLERRLNVARVRRTTLIRKARYAGLTVRYISRFAGITNVAVSNVRVPTQKDTTDD